MIKIIALPIFLFLTGCASPNFTPKYEKFGEYIDTLSLEEKADNMKWKKARNIKVYLGSLPKGLEEKKGKLISKNRKIKILGKVTTDIKKYNAYRFYKFIESEDWRNSYCNFQVPLTWITLSLWSILPTYYPCYVFADDSLASIHQRKKTIIKTLKKMVMAAGGNALVITTIGETVLVNQKTHIKLGGLKMTSASGYALKISKKEKK